MKDPVPLEKVSGVVYSIPYRECSEAYIGQTGCLLGTRLTEHRAAVKYRKIWLLSACAYNSRW